MGRCALHTTRSLAVSHATSAASPVSTSTCCIHGWRGRPRGRFHCGLLSGRWPVLALTARCSTMWAGVTSGSRLTWPNIAWRRLVILSRTLSRPVRFMMVALVTLGSLISLPVNCENTDVKQNRQNLFRVMQLTYYGCIVFCYVVRQFTVFVNK